MIFIPNSLASVEGAAENSTKDVRNKPPTEEERAALRSQREQEKLAKAQAKNAPDNLSPAELQKRDQEAAAIVPSSSGTSTVVRPAS